MGHLRTLDPSVLQCLPAGAQLILVAGNLPGALVHRCLLVRLVVYSHPFKVVDVVHNEAPLGSHDHASAVGNSQHGGRQRCHASVLINQCDVVLLIQMLIRIRAGGLYAQKIRPEEHCREIQRIYAQIQKAPARQLRLHHSRLILHVVAKVCRKVHRRTDDSLGQLIPHHLHEGHIARPDRLRNEHVLLLGQIEELPCLCLVYGKRLLHKAGLSVLDAGLCIGIVLGMRCCHIDKIHLRVIQQLLVGAVRLFGAVPSGKPGRLVQIPGCRRIQGKSLRFTNCLCHDGCDAAAAQNTNSNSCHAFLHAISVQRLLLIAAHRPQPHPPQFLPHCCLLHRRRCSPPAKRSPLRHPPTNPSRPASAPAPPW